MPPPSHHPGTPHSTLISPYRRFKVLQPVRDPRREDRRGTANYPEGPMPPLRVVPCPGGFASMTPY